ncbi:MAG TPA: type I-MYXAN CRISPR-associated protein Cmx8 [Pirellulales bacterium]|nr:type I-MYXAN CRISPR-associated protein Cmx8 [Pirellulales bacterium]
MGKRQKKDPVVRSSVTIEYDLFDLPTALHKAGLAGLLLQVQSMRSRGFSRDAVPEVRDDGGSTRLTVVFTETSAQALFNDLYAAIPVESEEKSLRKKMDPKTGKKTLLVQPKRTVPHDEPDGKSGRTKTVERYVYDVVQPCGAALADVFPGGTEGLWHKLWREALYAIPREKPLTRKPYEDCANGRPYSEGKRTVWEDLLAVDTARATGKPDLSKIKAGLALGVQEENAEQIQCLGRTDQNLLLHFWPLTTMIFVPQVISSDGDCQIGEDRRTRTRYYTLAIPEVSNLVRFCRLYPQMLQSLDARKRGYRPEGAVIDIPAQGALEFLEHLARLAKMNAEGQDWAPAVSAIQFFHMAKSGNNVKIAACDRLVPSHALLERYKAIVGSASDRPFKNPLFRGSLLLSALKDRVWYSELVRLFQERPWVFFVRGERAPRGIPWFATDAATLFRNLFQKSNIELEVEMNIDESGVSQQKGSATLDELIYRLVRNFLLSKAQEKSGVDLDKYKVDGAVQWEKLPAEFHDAKTKLAADVFLSVRPRRERDFVNYFSSRICSVKQFLSKEQYCTVANALATNSEDVKTLTMLALSANS